MCAVCAGISTLPPGLGELRDLEGLQVDGCPLLPPYANLYSKDPLLLVALHDRERLSLDLSDCSLAEVPADLQQRTQLTSLNLGKNNMTDLPTWLGNLRRLRQLTVKGNPLQQPIAR
jgi:Leucine-rich repeat (LRR) protein